ncbi:haloacid dehalogenase-like hydrolase domain-containing protein 1a [Stylonychia lemnae]|uniref:riboflavin kinase n=1 Tax=Stylonychia lemnae TaxID=5949 RepID=A0A078AQ23_STYLE|nr:haloacid dehalogenase-like hydrolase domain-containing protein 1a [Stylonychia lemnae]|eukprot:CDW83043.1 haloacid dehalogenase-like hydrolase domain-containing protein 1a [Stylonychia lemnae]
MKSLQSQPSIQAGYRTFYEQKIQDETDYFIETDIIVDHNSIQDEDLLITSRIEDKDRQNTIYIQGRNLYTESQSPKSLYDIDFSQYGLGDLNLEFRKPSGYVVSRNLVDDLPEYDKWHNHTQVEEIKIKGKVVKGFQRGSKQLGCPTANIEMTEENKKLTSELIPGVYSAFGKFINPTIDILVHSNPYKCALSIGWNPVYENTEKTVEVYIINDFFGNDFYGQEFEVTLKSFIRSEAWYSTFEDLILAISCDIRSTETYLEDKKL